MTQNTPADVPEHDHHHHDEDLPAAYDPLLESLVSSCHDGSNSVGVTLTVQGILVTGTIVGRQAWCDDMAAAYPDWAMIPQAWKQIFEQNDAEYGGDERTFNFIHLKDARTFVGVASVPTDGKGFWRGRLSEVSGWQLGTLGRTPDAD